MALIVVQMGHCYRTSGATGTAGVDADPTEQEFASVTAQACVAELADAGHYGQAILADSPDHLYAGDAFVAIHCDGSTSRTARGASVGYRTSQGQEFAAKWKQRYHEGGWTGFRPDNYTAALAGYYGTREAVAQGNRRAFIAEAGFLTSPADEALLWPDGPARFARALRLAVVDIFGGIPVAQPPTMEDEDMRTIVELEDGPRPGAWLGLGTSDYVWYEHPHQAAVDVWYHLARMRGAAGGPEKVKWNDICTADGRTLFKPPAPGFRDLLTGLLAPIVVTHETDPDGNAMGEQFRSLTDIAGWTHHHAQRADYQTQRTV